MSDSYFGQRTWCFAEQLAPFEGVLRFIYRYPGSILAAAGAAAFLGAALLLAKPSQRRARVGSPAACSGVFGQQSSKLE